ncbi:proteasome assembly chaperone family protein [Natronobiforma cellulositropha]|uniref:proteasome assembly chaperone family protein n=1 Tax=Natronobiforma cellulositropha TaxID=1679076 RepID=UPI0021D5CB84|nr:PAC2 family protein [Natronobiforma cellulositropha]
MTDELTIEVDADEPPESTLIVALPGPGMAGISATQYLIEQLALEETGHIQTSGLPAITPYTDGQPYHHTRLFSSPELECTFLTSELPVPLQLSEPFGRTLVEWIDERAIEEVTLLTSIPWLEPVDELCYVASEDYLESRLADSSIGPLHGGFLTGSNASLLSRAMDTTLRVGVIASAVDPRLPLDASAALRLAEGLDGLYGLDVDTTDLREFADRTHQHYEALAAQFEAQQEDDRIRPRVTDDYGFM